MGIADRPDVQRRVFYVSCRADPLAIISKVVSELSGKMFVRRSGLEDYFNFPENPAVVLGLNVRAGSAVLEYPLSQEGGKDVSDIAEYLVANEMEESTVPKR